MGMRGGGSALQRYARMADQAVMRSLSVHDALAEVGECFQIVRTAVGMAARALSISIWAVGEESALQRYARMADQAMMRSLSVHDALAGLVEGRGIGGMPVIGCWCF